MACSLTLLLSHSQKGLLWYPLFLFRAADLRRLKTNPLPMDLCLRIAQSRLVFSLSLSPFSLWFPLCPFFFFSCFSLFVAHFTRAQVGVCGTQFGTVEVLVGGVCVHDYTRSDTPHASHFAIWTKAHSLSFGVGRFLQRSWLRVILKS